MLNQLLGYTDANECRVLNNTIKHQGTVNKRSSKFPYFSSHVGKELPNIEFEMQRYYNGIWNLLGELIQKGNRLLDPNFRY